MLSVCVTLVFYLCLATTRHGHDSLRPGLEMARLQAGETH